MEVVSVGGHREYGEIRSVRAACVYLDARTQCKDVPTLFIS
jgi:hypothetical protein